MRQTASQSAKGTHPTVFPQFVWTEITEPGAYVELGTGNLYRIPKEALNGPRPIVVKESRDSSRMVQVSKDPYVRTMDARLSCARHNIRPNF
ncbi:MAG: hypothetical protein DMG59_26095 [Acidobacteria bacterium]|jgi:hypothetical protein|nr:MAG: hypothetical protein DMG59_26095 [Acidobacteriota bacterium]